MILGLRTAIYPVNNLYNAKTWYSKVLGKTPIFDQPFYVGFSVGGFELGLVPDGSPSVEGPQPLWGVANAEHAFARLIKLGATALEPVTNVGEGIKVAAVTDPFGNRLGIIENPHFKLSSEPTYLDGAEVHAGDRVNHAGKTGTVVFVNARRECAPGYVVAEWTSRGNVLIQQDDGQLFMYDSVSNEKGIELVERPRTA